MSRAGTGPGRASVGIARDARSRSPVGSPVENSPQPGAKTLSSRFPSKCSSLAVKAPLTGPLGPDTVWPTALTVTSSKTTAGRTTAW
jgi:hypothetical protein